MAALFVAMAIVATRPLVTDLSGHTLVGPDPLIDLWTLDWLTSHAGQPSEIFGGNIFYPEPRAVLYSDISMGTAALVLPFRPWVKDPVPLYNLGVILALAFAGWSFFLLGRALSGSLWSGITGGILAAFSSHQLYHVYHLNLLTTGWLALFLLGLHKLAQAPKARWALLVGVSFALSAQSSGYYAVAAAMLGLVFVLVYAKSFARSRAVATLGGALVVALALTTPYARAFSDLKEREGLRRPIGLSAQMSWRPLRDLGSQSYAGAALVGRRGERLFPGILVLVLAGVAATRRGRNEMFYGMGALVLLVFALGPRLRLAKVDVPLPYAALFSVPPLDAMRHPFTFAAVALFLLAILAALGLARLAIRRPWIAPVAALVGILETLAPPVNVRPVSRGVPIVYEHLAAMPRGPILEIPVTDPETLLWAARHRLPVVNGVGAFLPPHTAALERAIQNHWIETTPADLDDSKPATYLVSRFDPRYVVVPVGRKPALRALADAFDGSRRFRFVEETAEGDRLYVKSARPALPDAEAEPAEEALRP